MRFQFAGSILMAAVMAGHAAPVPDAGKGKPKSQSELLVGTWKLVAVDGRPAPRSSMSFSKEGKVADEFPDRNNKTSTRVGTYKLVDGRISWKWDSEAGNKNALPEGGCTIKELDDSTLTVVVIEFIAELSISAETVFSYSRVQK